MTTTSAAKNIAENVTKNIAEVCAAARYAAFAKAEASMLNNALCIPCLYEVLWCLTHVNEYTKINAMYGPCNYKAVNWETRQGDGYTTEEYEAFSAAFNAATKA